MTVRVEPITDADVERVAHFLHAQLNGRVTPDAWARAMRVPWQVDAPNHGYLLRDDDGDRVVGAYLAFYSERRVNGRPERFCNLGAWCVLDDYRAHGLRLLRALLAQPGYHFTDLSPSGNVIGINTRLKFRFLDTATALVPNLPWPSWPGRGRISDDPALIRRTLTGEELRRYEDHANAAAVRHLILIRGDESCWVMFRRDRRKKLPLFASILYVSNPDLFRAMSRRVARHLLLRYGIPASLMELTVVAHRPRPSLLLSAPRPKMYLSPHLEPHQIDNLYSELVCLAW